MGSQALAQNLTVPAASPISTSSSPSSSPSSPGSAAAVSTPGVPNASTTSLFTGLFGDFRNLKSTDTAMWLGIGAGLALAGHPEDTRMSRSFSRSEDTTEAFSSGRIIGGGAVQLAGALATFTAGRMSGSPTTTKVGSEMFRAIVVSQAVTSVLKVSVSRTRPDGTSNSFPSGHTANAFATATVLQRNLGWKVGLPAYAVASFVGASRIQTQRHYLSDVAFGATVGILAGRTVSIGPKEAKFAVSPVAVPGGGGVNFNWVGSSK
jgi:membrane-associated phospholipid phosphatase